MWFEGEFVSWDTELWSWQSFGHDVPGAGNLLFADWELLPAKCHSPENPGTFNIPTLSS